jgi:hypothetical protein
MQMAGIPPTLPSPARGEGIFLAALSLHLPLDGGGRREAPGGGDPHEGEGGY